METVIAEYQDFISAERAVRGLERQGISIQNVSIVDEAKRFWRKSHPAWARRSAAQQARPSFLLGAIASLVFSQLLLAAYVLATGQPLKAASTWFLVCSTVLLGGCASALISLRRSRERAGPRRRRVGFSVILRSDAATLAAVGHFFPRARAAADNRRHG
jgi:hypothetical protein